MPPQSRPPPARAASPPPWGTPSIQWTVRCGLLAAVAICLSARLGAQAAAAPPTVVQVLHRALAAAEADNQALEQYAWNERDIVREIGKDGQPGKIESDETIEASQVDGVEYDRTIARNGKPLTPAEQAKEDRKQANFIREQDSPKKRAARLREQAKARRQREELIEEIPAAFEIEMAPAGGAPLCDCYVLRATARPGYRARDKNVELLRHVAFTAWVDRQSYGLVRLRANILQTISLGWFLARIGKGGTLQYDTVPVEGHRLMGSLTGELSARVLLVKGFHLELDVTDSDYRKFGSTAKVLVAKPGGGAPPRANEW